MQRAAALRLARHFRHPRHLRHLRHTGRAAVEIGWVMHHVSHFLLTVVVLLSVAAIGGAWRLSRGPVSLDFIKDRVERAVDSSIAPLHVTIGGASIAWGGFSRGLDQPLILRMTDLTVEDGAGTATVHVPTLEAALSARWLLIGRVLPRTITLQGARLILTRGQDGAISFAIGGVGATGESGASPLIGLLGVLGSPAQTDLQAGGGRLSQLSAVSIHGATLRLDDRMLNMTWSADRADIDLTRHRGGGVDGRATLVLALGEQQPVLAARFTLPPAARSAHVAASLSPVKPGRLGDSMPALAPLSGLDLPVTLDGEADLGPDLAPEHVRLTARAGAGSIAAEGGAIPINRAELTLAGTPEQATLETAVVELRPSPGGAISTVSGTGQLTHQGGRVTAMLHLALDHVAFADLPALWPRDLSPPTRAWITQNIPSGRAHDGRVELVLESPDTAPDISLLSATATADGDDVAVIWLPTVPRVEQARAHLVLTDPDKVEIDVRSARQKVNGAESIGLQNGHVTIAGLSKKDQVATVQLDATGSVASAIALLKEPRLHVLDKHPMDLRAPAGDARIGLRVVVPLELNLNIVDVTIQGTGALSKVHLTGIAAGRDLDDGTLSLDVDTSHLAIKGTGRLAGIPSTIDVMMDFRSGPPSQVLQRIAVSGRATGQALADAGLDTADVVTGEVGLDAVLSEYRNGDGDILADADLTQSGLTVSPLAWHKPVGEAAKASARVTLSKDRLTGIDRIAIDGAGARISGTVSAVDGKLDTVRLDRLVLGRTDVRGTIRLPRGGPIDVDLSGATLDVGAKLLEKSPKRDPALPPPPPGPAWSIRGRFDRVLLAHDQVVSQMVVAGDSDGQVTRALSVTGKSGSGKAFSLRIGGARTPDGQLARRLTITLDDAGAMLQGVGVTEDIKGGVMTVTGAFDDTIPNHPLSGTLEITDFRVSHAPALGKLLQAVTLYGLVDALGGPGLGFSRLTAPFQLDDDALTLRDARAFSPSLGLTAKGRIDRSADRLDVEGTLVPAYVFNSILGRIPLIGGLFSAEKGGGLFAMNYSLRGSLDNPTVIANPLSALTPGFLRGMFGLFDREAPDRQASPLDRASPGGNAR
jgi:hypothetical protein